MFKIFLLLSVCVGVGLRAESKFMHTNSCYTHQPVLYEMINKTTGPIIEFGCGEGSTPLLHEICKKTGRLLISLDDNLEYLNLYAQRYLDDGYFSDNSGWHKFIFVPKKNIKNTVDFQHWIDFLDTCELLKYTNFDICFIDQAPFEARLETLKQLKSKSKYVIVHDCDDLVLRGLCGTSVVPTTYNTLGVYDFSDILRYAKVYAPQTPWPESNGPCTLLGSDYESDFPEIVPENYISY